MLLRTPLVLVVLAISDLGNSINHRSQHSTMDASVILPLYVYPSAGAWDPVYEMASSYPRVQFTAIVNPHSGPGEGALPSESYTQAIQVLNSFNNVRTIGYVATTWCKKNVSSVLDEISVYAGWGKIDPSLAMDGIFLDETPTIYSSEYVSYFKTISQAVGIKTDGLTNSYIVHNPGALPEAQYFGDPEFVNSTDVVIIFENDYASWVEQGRVLTDLVDSYDRRRLATIVHSLPSFSPEDAESFLPGLLAVGLNIFLTKSHNYTELDSSFQILVDSLDNLLNY